MKNGLDLIKTQTAEKMFDVFRGVNFHICILTLNDQITPLLPSFIGDSNQNLLPSSLDTIQDSIKLGQFMLYTGILLKFKKHSGLIATKNSKEEKFAKFVEPDVPVFTYDCYYSIT